MGGGEPAYGRILHLAVPVILSNLSIPLLGAVDTAVVGHLDAPNKIGGVAVGALIFSFLYWGFGFLRMGTTGLAAQARGGARRHEAGLILLRALALGAAIGLVLILLQVPLRHVAIPLVGGSETVSRLAADYFAIRIWSAPFVMANYAFMGWFIGMQNTRALLISQLWMNGLNIVLDLVLVLKLGMGVEGVALATAIAEISAVFIALPLAIGLARRHGVVLADFRGFWSPPAFRHLLAVNVNIFIRTLLLIFSFSYFTAAGARQGDVVLAANAVLMNFLGFLSYGLDGFANAAEALVGEAIGRNDRDLLRRAVLRAGAMGLALSLFYMLVYALWGDGIVALLTAMAPVRQAAGSYLPWVVLAPLLSFWCFHLDGIFIGAARTAEMRNAMIVSAACYLTLAEWLQGLYGNHGLWAALMVFFVLRALALALYYPRLEKRSFSRNA